MSFIDIAKDVNVTCSEWDWEGIWDVSSQTNCTEQVKCKCDILGECHHQNGLLRPVSEQSHLWLYAFRCN